MARENRRPITTQIQDGRADGNLIWVFAGARCCWAICPGNPLYWLFLSD